MLNFKKICTGGVVEYKFKNVNNNGRIYASQIKTYLRVLQIPLFNGF